MEKIIFLAPNVSDYLEQLVETLYSKEYFGFRESAHEYVDRIQDAVHNLHVLPHYGTPKELKKHGKFYAKIKSNKRTMWYVFFNKNKNRYLVKYITNNHVADAKFLKHF